MGFFGGVQYYSENIKHRINNLSHSSEWNMRDISLSGYIFTRLRLVKYLTIFHSDSCNIYNMLACHITAAITACIIIVDMAIPLTRVNRLVAMRESDERITSIFTPFLQGPLRFTYALVTMLHGCNNHGQNYTRSPRYSLVTTMYQSCNNPR